MSEDDRLDIFDSLPSDIPLLNPEHLIANLWNQQAKGDFDLIFDSTMTDIADKNIDIFQLRLLRIQKYRFLKADTVCNGRYSKSTFCPCFG